MAGWHHRLDGREFEWTPGVGDGQGGLVCCNSWGHKESDTTERLNWTELNWRYLKIYFLSCHTWMLAWLSRSLDYQLDFGAASFFFFFQYFGDVIQLSSVGFLDVCSALWNLSIFSQLPGVSPAMCAASCLAKNPGLFAGIWVSFSVQLPSPKRLTQTCQLSCCLGVPVSVLSPLWLHFCMPSLQKAPWRKPRWTCWLHNMFTFS